MSSRRSPRSYLDTNDCGLPSFLASDTWVRPAVRRASANSLRKYWCLRLNAERVTGRVCYPKLEYPKTGYSNPRFSGGQQMPTNDPNRLRVALDQIANALQPAALVAGRLRQASAGAAEDAATVDKALTQAVTILKSVQANRDG